MRAPAISRSGSAPTGDTTQLKTFARTTAKARTRDSMTAFEKLTHIVDGQPRIRAEPPLIVPIDELFEGVTDREAVEGIVRSVFRDYRRTLQDDRRHLLEQFEFVDLARKVVGVGSVGTRCWIVLLLGRDSERSPLHPGQGGAGVGARALPRTAATTPITASASSPASG